jgi:DNA-binding beta-propeller fold protein YncE
MTNIRVWKFIVFSIIIIFLSCSPRSHKPVSTDNIVIFPPPPDTTRIQYLTHFSNSLDITGQRKGFVKFILGEDKGRPIIKPYGITVRNGKIYICDTILGGLEIINLGKKTFDYFQPGGKGQLKKPVNCFVDEDNLLYVSDAERRQIVVFDEQGRYLDSFGATEESKLTDVFVYKNKIWVCDLKTHKIHVYSQETHQLIFSFPDAEYQTPGFLYSPTNLYLRDERVYVTDFGDFKIKEYTLEGEFVRAIGSYGRTLGQLVRPKGIAVDRDLNLYVVDAGFENVQIFNPEGNLLMFFGGDYKGPGFMWLPAKVVIDYDHLHYFQKYVDKSFELKYLIFVTNQYGPDKINVYGFVEPKQDYARSK